jgi:hypothetical protein
LLGDIVVVASEQVKPNQRPSLILGSVGQLSVGSADKCSPPGKLPIT